MKEIIFKNLKNAKDIPIEKDLHKLLKSLTITDLQYIGDLFLIRGLSRKRKNDLIKEIYRVLTDPDRLQNILGRLIKPEFVLLKRVLENQGTLQDNYIEMREYYFLHTLGIFFLFKREDQFYISMPDDVYQAFIKIDLHALKKKVMDNTKAHDLLLSMVELYGVCSSNDFEDAYMEYYNCDYKGLSMDWEYCDRLDLYGTLYIGREDYYVHPLLLHEEFDEIVVNIISRQASIPRKEIELSDLLKYKDSKYYEMNPSREKFKKYLMDQKVPKKKIEKISRSICTMNKLGHESIGYIFSYLENCGIHIEKDEIQKVLDLLTDLYNNTRIWVNHGWTSIELRESSNS